MEERAMTISVITAISFLFIFFHSAYADVECSNSFDCGTNVTRLEYPFSDKPDCGLFTVNCNYSPPNFNLQNGEVLQLSAKKTSNKVAVYDPNLQIRNNSCNCTSLQKLSLPNFASVSFSTTPFHLCSQTYSTETRILDCQENAAKLYSYKPLTSRTFDCSVLHLPFNLTGQNLDGRFDLEWKLTKVCQDCITRGGRCRDTRKKEFICDIAVGAPDASPAPHASQKWKKKVIIAVSVIFGSAILFVLCFLIYSRRNTSGAPLPPSDVPHEHSQSGSKGGIPLFGSPVS